MLRIFHQYRPRQVARYVKAFSAAKFTSTVWEPLVTEGEIAATIQKNKRALAVMTEVNNEIKAMAAAA